jgi:hypothetical protein
LEWISASEGEKVKSVMNDMAEKLRNMGPLGVPKRFQEWDKEMDLMEKELISEEVTSNV